MQRLIPYFRRRPLHLAAIILTTLVAVAIGVLTGVGIIPIVIGSIVAAVLVAISIVSVALALNKAPPTLNLAPSALDELQGRLKDQNYQLGITLQKELDAPISLPSIPFAPASPLPLSDSSTPPSPDTGESSAASTDDESDESATDSGYLLTAAAGASVPDDARPKSDHERPARLRAQVQRLDEMARSSSSVEAATVALAYEVEGFKKCFQIVFPNRQDWSHDKSTAIHDAVIALYQAEKAEKAEKFDLYDRKRVALSELCDQHNAEAYEVHQPRGDELPERLYNLCKQRQAPASVHRP